MPLATLRIKTVVIKASISLKEIVFEKCASSETVFEKVLELELKSPRASLPSLLGLPQGSAEYQS